MFSNQTVVSATLPAMAIRGRVPLPNNEIRIDVGRKESILALKEAVEGNKYIALLFNLTIILIILVEKCQQKRNHC